jgi:hypothetical protein
MTFLITLSARAAPEILPPRRPEKENLRPTRPAVKKS